jgi:hypothetical protein
MDQRLDTCGNALQQPPSSPFRNVLLIETVGRTCSLECLLRPTVIAALEAVINDKSQAHGPS